ncbi:hypothetical protein CRG98_003890 [Punica granatum]|uniref:Uncharacterized protein n=1 Tax=Punica granatum TaxID=22663 RepID=A0A2I0L4X4_PUNGR|nr:hypothetical protein CRG98_003890 [Punica granatum]
MASALLSASLFHPSKNGDGGLCMRNFRSSVYGKVPSNPSSIRKEAAHLGGRLVINSATTRVRFVFDDEALEVKIGEQLQESGENVFVGGKNRWKYSTFVNWELWWPNFPILVYFKETQTKPEGQVHFFPVIFV